MALLYRMVRIDDRGATHVYSFVVTRTVTRELHRDLTTKEFPFGFHRWAVMFSRSDKQLGVYLVWKSTSESLTLHVDFAFSLLNREHFSGNESFSGKQIQFSNKSPAQGNRRFIAIATLCDQKFADVNGEFQLELTMTNLHTSMHISWPVPESCCGPLDSGQVTYGGFDWTATVAQCQDRVRFCLQQTRASHHRCRLRYSVGLSDKGGEGSSQQSAVFEEVVSERVQTNGWTTLGTLSGLSSQGRLSFHCNLMAATGISEVVLPIHENTDLVQCQDLDLQTWALQTDTHGALLRIRLVFSDISLIPRNHLRYASWNVYLVRHHPRGGFLSPSLVAGGPFCCYYVQEASDEGLLIDTDVPVKELNSPGSLYVDDQKQVTVQVEWLQSALLFQSTYHKYDDINRTHNFQMRREISALQSENFSLERQLFSYQKSIAFASSRGTYSDDVPSPPDPSVAPKQLATARDDPANGQLDSCANGASSTASCYVRQLSGHVSESCYSAGDNDDYNA